MRTPLSLSYALILSLTLSSCSSGFGDRKKLGRQSSATSSAGSSASGADVIDPATQAAEKTRLVAEGKKSLGNLLNLKTQLEVLEKKLPQLNGQSSNPQEVLTSLSTIIGDIENNASTLKDIAEAHKAVSNGKKPEKTAGFSLADAAQDQSLVDAQIMLRRVTRLSAAINEYFAKGTADCKNDPTPTSEGFSAASFYSIEDYEHCRSVNRTVLHSSTTAATLSLLEPSIFDIIGTIIRSLITLIIRIVSSLVLGFLYGEDGSELVLNPLLGEVMHFNKTKAVFWGAEWKNDTSDVIPGLEHFLTAWGDSHPASLAIEYYDIHGPVTAKSEYVGKIFDDTPLPPADVKILIAIIDRVCKLTDNNPNKDTIYMVYTYNAPAKYGWNVFAGEVPVGAIHYPGLCGLKPFQITWMPRTILLDFGKKSDWGGHSPLLSSLADASAHELWETMINPLGDGWYTLADMGEVGDRCYTTFPPTEDELSTLSDGSKWRLQTLWSNAAFKAKSGIGPKKGCIY